MTGKHRLQQQGFTLFELLVAIVIFAVVSAVSYGTLIRIIDQDEHLEGERRYWQQVTLALTRLEDDLAFASPRKVRDASGLPLAAFYGRPVDSRELSPPSLEFTRTGQWTLATSQAPGLQRIAYRLREGELLREVWASLDRAPVDQPLSVPLIKDVEQFELRFYDTGNQWNATWPTEENSPALPVGVELTIKTHGREVIRRLFLVNG